MRLITRIVLGFIVGMIGAGATLFAADRIGAVGEMVLGGTPGAILQIIVAIGGLAVTVAIVLAIVKPSRTPSPSR